MDYYKPIVSYGKDSSNKSMPIAGGKSWFTEAEVLSRNKNSSIIDIKDIPVETLKNITGTLNKIKKQLKEIKLTAIEGGEIGGLCQTKCLTKTAR